MKIYIVTDVFCNFKENEYKNDTFYFSDEKEALNKLVFLHDDFCGVKIKKRCKNCGWKKGLNNIIRWSGDVYDGCVYISTLDTDLMPSIINLTCSFGSDNPKYKVNQQTIPVNNNHNIHEQIISSNKIKEQIISSNKIQEQINDDYVSI